MGDDEDAYDDEDGQPGTKGEEPTGTDTAGGNDESEVPAEQPDQAADAGEPPSRGAGEPASQSRGAQRFQRLSDDVKAARAEADRARQELENYRREQWQNNQNRAAEEERARMALMTPEERNEYRFNQQQRTTDQRLQQMELRATMMMDKATFDAKTISNPVYKKFASAVEARFDEQMRKGQPVDRETILKYLLGESALNGAGNSSAARKQARRRVEAQTVRPSSGKGDTERPGTRKSSGMSEAETRLKDILI
jgi:hypothetical protein